MFTRPKRHVKKVYIHCSASDAEAHDNIETIRKWHVEEKGWSDVGYHYFLTKNGTIQEGRPLEKVPSAQKGHNTGSIAICLSGLESFTLDQFDTLREFCNEINKAYNREITFHGHCEVSDKTCPVFDYKKVLSLDDEGYIISLPLITNLKPKKKMVLSLAVTGAVSLVKLFAPSIIAKFKKAGKNLAESTAKKLIKKVEKKLGFQITDEKSAEKAREELDSKDLLDLEKLALKTDAQKFSDELKHGEDLTKSWKDEFVTVITFTTFIGIVIMTYVNPVKAPELVSVIKALLSTPFGALFIFVGVSAIGGKHIMTKIADKFIK